MDSVRRFHYEFILLIELLVRRSEYVDSYSDDCGWPWTCYCEECVYQMHPDDEPTELKAIADGHSFEYVRRVAGRTSRGQANENNTQFAQRYGISRRQAAKIRVFARKLGYQI